MNLFDQRAVNALQGLVQRENRVLRGTRSKSVTKDILDGTIDSQSSEPPHRAVTGDA